MSIEIERHRRDGRGLVDQHTNAGEVIAGWPEIAESALRAVTDLTLTTAPIPAPTLYDVLSNLKTIGHLMPQVLDQLAEGLQRSLEVYDVFDTPGSPPADTVATARRRLHLAAAAAAMLGRELEAAQAAIAHQGYRAHRETPDRPGNAADEAGVESTLPPIASGASTPATAISARALPAGAPRPRG